MESGIAKVATTDVDVALVALLAGFDETPRSLLEAPHCWFSGWVLCGPADGVSFHPFQCPEVVLAGFLEGNRKKEKSRLDMSESRADKLAKKAQIQEMTRRQMVKMGVSEERASMEVA